MTHFWLQVQVLINQLLLGSGDSIRKDYVFSANIFNMVRSSPYFKIKRFHTSFQLYRWHWTCYVSLKMKRFSRTAITRRETSGSDSDRQTNNLHKNHSVWSLTKKWRNEKESQPANFHNKRAIPESACTLIIFKCFLVCSSQREFNRSRKHLSRHCDRHSSDYRTRHLRIWIHTMAFAYLPRIFYVLTVYTKRRAHTNETPKCLRNRDFESKMTNTTTFAYKSEMYRNFLCAILCLFSL